MFTQKFKEIFWLIECWQIVLSPRIWAFLTNLKEIYKYLLIRYSGQQKPKKKGKYFLLKEHSWLLDALSFHWYWIIQSLLLCQFDSKYDVVLYLLGQFVFLSFVFVFVSLLCGCKFSCVCVFTGWNLLRKLNPIYGSFLIYRVHYMKAFPFQLQRNAIYPLQDK